MHDHLAVKRSRCLFSDVLWTHRERSSRARQNTTCSIAFSEEALDALEQHFSTSFSMSERFPCRSEWIGRGDWDVQLALGDQPGAGLDGCQDFGGRANLWSFEPKAADRHLAEDDVRGIRYTGLPAHEGIEHQSASTAQAAGKRHHRFPADAVER